MQEAAAVPSHLIPSRLGRSGDDPIFALNAEANARKARGEDVLNATLGALLDDEGKLAVLPTAARAVQEVASVEWAAYAPIAGMPGFLEAVVQDLFGHDPALAAQAVAVASPGGSGALRHAIATCLEPGQALLTGSFYWGPYGTLAAENERRVETFEMFAPAEAPAVGPLDVRALDEAMGRQIDGQGRVLLILNDPCHNPSGYSMSVEDWDGVVEVVLRHAARAPVTVLLDNAYAAYGPPDAMTTALAALTRLAEHALVLVAWSASKSFTHYGLRVGALVGLVPDPQERAALDAALSFASRGTWSNCNRGGMVAVTRLLTDPACRPAVDAERAALIALLGERVAAFNSAAQAAGLRYPRYAGGFFTTVLTDEAPARAARMREEGVFVVPIRGALRLGICALAADSIPRAVDALARALR
jgi:aromatic-amino-acid transaminase